MSGNKCRNAYMHAYEMLGTRSSGQKIPKNWKMERSKMVKVVKLYTMLKNMWRRSEIKEVRNHKITHKKREVGKIEMGSVK